MEEKIRNVFVSHFHGHDEHVDKLTDVLAGRNFQIRNSSIRSLKPLNRDRWKMKDDQASGLKPLPRKTIERWLRRKISWAGATVVLIGKETAERDWINWEIREAHQQGKRIVGVYLKGATESDLPEDFKKYATSLVEWDPSKIIAAIEGRENDFENPNGTPSMKKDGVRIIC